MITRLKNKIGRMIEGRKERLKPSFLIIGGQKCGTTALYEYLARHPNVSAPEVKELDFFNCKSRFEKGVEFYHCHFPEVDEKSAGKVTFEASPAYLFNPQAPRRIYDYNAELKLIAVLREPVDRAFSAWNMYRKRYKVNEDWFAEWMRRCDREYDKHPFIKRDVARFDSFEHVVEEELKVIEKGGTIEATILRHGFYCEQIERYLNFFSRDQILILENDAFKANTIGILRLVEDFLGIIHHDWSGEDTKPVFVGEYESVVPDKARETLIRLYEPHNEKLFALCGRKSD